MLRPAILVEPGSPHAEGYLEALASAPDVKEIAIVDGDETFTKRAQRYPGGQDKQWKRFASYGELLDQYRPDFAIASYAAYNAPPIIARALDAGAHVLAEKPGCVKVEDFAKLARLADSKHKHLMLAVANRSIDLVKKARELVQQRAIGQPYAANIMLVADQTRLKRAGYEKTWTAVKSQALGGIFSWLSIHYVDLLQHLTGDRFTQATAMVGNANRLPMDVEDSVAAALSMSKGLLATVHGGYYMDRGYQSGFQLWGSDGYLRFSLHGPDARQLEWQSYKSPLVQAVTYPMGPSAYSLFVHEAMKAAATNTAPPINTAESLHLIETVVAAYRSAEQGRVQRIG